MYSFGLRYQSYLHKQQEKDQAMNNIADKDWVILKCTQCHPCIPILE